MPWVCLVAVLATACGDKDDTGAPDADGDGYTALEDCDDDNAAVYPDAPELCDELDNDCDDVVDEFVTELWYIDADGDGYGDPIETVEACSQPSGTVADDTDCDDDDAGIHPGADELCDDEDNDCDGDWDEDAIDATSWYPDADGDGYGPDDGAVLSCEQPSDHVALGGDCDDADADLSPDADELCDEIDNDCDGAVDEDDAIDPLSFYLDDDGDGFGQDEQTAEACVAPSGYAADPGDCDDADATVNPGADEYCDDIDQDCDGEVDDDDAVDAPLWYPDADGDGYGDPDGGVQQCYESGDLVSNDGDCDDTDADVNPDAAELCNEIDDNCDGDIDEDTAIDAVTWWLDGDGDLFGDDDATTLACYLPSGYADMGGDCDDADADVNPAEVAYCDDGLDNDCRGADHSCPSAAELLITEIMKDPNAMGDSSGEWFEIYNNSADTLEIEGLIVYDLGGESWLIDDTLEIEAGDYAVLARSSSATTEADVIWSGFQLVNTEDEVVLATYGTDGTDGDVIHQIEYDDSDWPDTAGASLSLDPDAFTDTDSVLAANWCAGQSVYDTGDKGTPGAANDDCP